MTTPQDITPLQREKIESAIDRLDSFIASLVNMRTLPDSIHVSALREGLPSVAKDLRAALNGNSE